MEIKINGKHADIVPENEKTIGEIIAGIENYLSSSGHRISGISINGQAVNSSLIGAVFIKPLDGINEIDLTTSSLAALAAESFISLLNDIREYEALDYEKRKSFYDSWKESAQARFTLEQSPDLHGILTGLFLNGSIEADTAYSLTEERLLEVKDPKLELLKLKPLIEEVSLMLVDLPIDIQTGKDLRAAQSIQYFSSLSQKLLRLLRQLCLQGILPQKIHEDEEFSGIAGGFGPLIDDLLRAYEKNDTVLLGDLAEYEASVKLKQFYNIILCKCADKDKVQ